MEFYNVTDLEKSLYHDCLFHLGLSSSDLTTFPVDGEFTRRCNDWYRRVNTWIWRVTGTWEYDDSNWTNLPVATRTLVADQQDYEIPSTAQKIDRVEVLDSDKNYQVIKPIDKSMIKNQSMSEYFETAGMPIYYDLVGRSLLLYPKPAAANVTTTKGLQVYFSRDISEFTPASTDTEPGFVNTFHSLLSLGPALDYARVHMPDRVNNLRIQIAELKKDLQEFYGSRHRDLKARFNPKKQDYE